jgi:tetratricopeptide (TPR) repeat protein
VKLSVVILTAFSLACAFRTGAQETHSHPPPEKLGTVEFATSCAPSVAQQFNRSVVLLHSFAYSASEEAFRNVASSDPHCAMAHWGIAMSLYHELWSPPSPAELRTGETEIEQASHLDASPREKLYIAAVAAYYRDSEHVAPQARAKAYETGMAEVARSNPGDTEAQVFYALSLIATAPPTDGTHANQKRAVAILEPIYRTQPDHPGVAHYLIHANDSTELAAHGLAAARDYSKIAPSAPHALHMPSHIFTRLGLWDDSIASNKAARAAAHAQGDIGEELHAMDYLTYAYLQRGQDSDAAQLVASLGAMNVTLGDDFKVGYAATAMPVRLAVERQMWADAASLSALPGSPPHVSALVYWARAVADSHLGRPQAADGDIAKIEECRQKLQAAGNTYWATQVDVLDKEAKAWQLAASAHPEESVLLLTQAADEEDAVDKSPATPGPIVPAREQLGDLLLQLHRPKQALSAYQAALVAAPGRRGSLTGAVKAAELAGDTKIAAQMRAQLGG